MSDSDNAYTFSGEPRLLLLPPEPTWRWCFGGDWHSLTVHVVKAPNRFHRFMMKHCLGVHWEKL